jgi:putative ABC transport system substrate-binding protein
VAGRKIGVPIRFVGIGGDREYLGDFAAVAREKVGAMLVASSSMFNTNRIELAALAIRYGISTMFEIREFGEAGGANELRTKRTGCVSSGRELCGAGPQRQNASQSSLTAKALGTTIPPMLLARVDEVIE